MRSGRLRTRAELVEFDRVALLQSLILTAVVEVLPIGDMFIRSLLQDKEALGLQGFGKVID